MSQALQFSEADLLLTIAKWFFISLNSGIRQIKVHESKVDIININYLNGMGKGGGGYSSIGHFILFCNQPVPSSPLPPVSDAIMSFYYWTALLSLYRIKPRVSRGKPRLLHKNLPEAYIY